MRPGIISGEMVMQAGNVRYRNFRAEPQRRAAHGTIRAVT
jgi:hypothetical protein